jgi:hypothetical protein
VSSAPGNQPGGGTAPPPPGPDPQSLGEHFAEHRFGNIFTNTNVGEDAKAVKLVRWQEKARALNDDYSDLAERLSRQNPCVVCNPVGDPNAQAYVIMEVDSEADLERFKSYARPRRTPSRRGRASTSTTCRPRARPSTRSVPLAGAAPTR